MLRLNYLHMRGGLLVKRDRYVNCISALCEVSEDTISSLNTMPDKYDTVGNSIKSFANRDNNGTQPVPDDFPVVICGNNGVERSKLAIDVEWNMTASRSSNGAYYAIKSWKPDIAKLLEQQNEYDNQQEKPIEEIILDAKSGLTRHDLIGGKVMTQQQENMREFASWLLAEIEDSMTIGDDISSLYDKFLNHKKLESELEIAKEKQITQLACKYSVVHSELELQNLFSKMQRLGDLAEITLPLKEV